MHGYRPGVLPFPLTPMLAVAGPLPPEDGRWSYEVKWDGVRALVAVQDGRVQLRSRAGNDITSSYPELSAVSLAGDALLDAEVVALDAAGRPDFGLLQARMHVARPSAALRGRTPVALVVFDVLYAGGHCLLDMAYDGRRELLAGLGIEGDHWQVPPAFPGDGAALLASTAQQGLEGVVAKRRDSRYEPGRRSDSWVKVKNVRRQSAVVVGWQPGRGGRAGRVGSLLLAVQGADGLHYAGHVGTGFSAQALALLGDLLAPLAVAMPACTVPREHTRGARWVRPELVAEVEFTAWTREGRLRHPSYKGLRDDVAVADLVRE